MKNKVFHNPISASRSIIAPRRAIRYDILERREIDPEVLSFEPVKCNVDSFKGVHLEQRQCPFAPGREWNTTFEYARYEHGNLISHNPPVYPENANSEWELRAIDNKTPLFDEVDLIEKVEYRLDSREVISGVETVDALGKSYLIIETRDHIVPTPLIDFFKVFKISQLLTIRELKKPYVHYVALGKNNAGLPQKVTCPLCRQEYYKWESYICGASQPHPHSEIFSMAFLPMQLEQEMKYTEKYFKEHGVSPYEQLLQGEDFVLLRGKCFSMIVDPAPKFFGTITIIAHEAHNITELNDEQLKELATFVSKAQQLLDLKFGGYPGNIYFKQSFKWQIEEFPHTRMRVKLFVRRNIHGFLEHSTGIIGMEVDPLELKEEYKILLKKYVKEPTFA
ncbi:MAG: hypothetical protein QXL15_01560 [Candidatus Korarchaeota archaeon]